MRYRTAVVTALAISAALISAIPAYAVSSGPFGTPSVAEEDVTESSGTEELSGGVGLPRAVVEDPEAAGAEEAPETAAEESFTGVSQKYPSPFGVPVYAEPSYITGSETPIFDGGSLTMLYGRTGAQMLSVLLLSKEGGLVVVDGGWEGDADTLLREIKIRGGHVNAWLITHPDFDHIGALYNILNRPDPGIVIDHVYTCMADPSWYYQIGDSDAALIDIFDERLDRLPEGTVSRYLPAGMMIDVPGIEIKVLNEAYFGTTEPAVNNSCVVYRVMMNGVSILFLGDLGGYGGSLLLENTAPEDLKADIVQMAHHGQSGVAADVYEAVSPSICLWPTPEWLWNNDKGYGYNSGPWRTLETRRWICLLGVTRNYVMKDGDIFLR